MKKETKKTLLIVTIYAIAMGFLEAAVVIYLRKLYYPNGFDFPLPLIDSFILKIDWIREMSTIIMLLTIALLAGKKLYEKFAYFIYAFAIWDIFYYVFLKATLNWPSSLMAWDVLFLIPWPWIAPILVPLLCIIILVITSLLIIHFNDLGYKVKITLPEWILFILGALIVLYTLLYDYGNIILFGSYLSIQNFIPTNYSWVTFSIGIILASIATIKFYLRTKKQM